MKKQIKLVSLFCSICFTCAILCAQTKEKTFTFTKNAAFHKVLTSGDNTFIIIDGEGLQTYAYYDYLSKIKKVKNNVMKYNQDLEPVWKEPVALLSSDFHPFNSFTYTNATTQTTFDYLIGTEQFVQIRPDGSAKEQKTGIPKKEIKNTAAVFTDTNGLNILTIVGDETFPTGTMNWYTFSHENLSLTKRKITLPMPPNTAETKESGFRLLSRIVPESGWRLNEVTASGLYFYCVSVKNHNNENASPILSAHVIAVDPTGQAKTIINMPSDVKKHNFLAVNYQQDMYLQLSVIKPSLYKRGMTIIHDPLSGNTIPSDNAFMGVKIDANAKRIYTVVTMHSDSAKHKGFVGNINMSIAYLRFSIYDLEGQKIEESHLKMTLPRLRADLPADIYQKIDISPMSNTEGVICKFMSLENGFLWAFNNKGEVIAEDKIKPYFYKGSLNIHYYKDIFAAHYASLKDMKDSPYLLKEKSTAYQFFQKLEDKAKQKADYYSLKDYELITVWDANKIKFYSFNKN